MRTRSPQQQQQWATVVRC